MSVQAVSNRYMGGLHLHHHGWPPVNYTSSHLLIGRQHQKMRHTGSYIKCLTTFCKTKTFRPQFHSIAQVIFYLAPVNGILHMNFAIPTSSCIIIKMINCISVEHSTRVGTLSPGTYVYCVVFWGEEMWEMTIHLIIHDIYKGPKASVNKNMF